MDLDKGFRLEGFVVHPRQFLLEHDGQSTRLEPKVMAVLVFLAENAGEVMTRDQFADGVWRGRVVSDEVLSRDISMLRGHLGDDAREPRFIQTIPRVGYRLIAQVSPLVAAAPAPIDPPLVEPPDAGAPVDNGATVAPVDVASGSGTHARLGTSGRARLVWGTVAATALLVAYWIVRDDQPDPVALDPRRVAVLPFVNLTDKPDTQYFSDGLTDEIFAALSAQAAGIRVVARKSSFAFRESKKDIRTIAQVLGAGSLLEGTVRRDGERLRVTARLIDVTSGLQVWSQAYERRLADVFQVQDDISRAIVGHLVGQLEPHRVKAPPTANLAAYELYLRAQLQLSKRGAVPLHRAIELFDQAIALDPKFGRAYVGLAEANMTLPGYTGEAEAPRLELALAAIDRARALGLEADSRVLAIEGFIALRQWRWEESQHAFARAISESPDDADIRQWYSQFLANVGYTAASLQEAAKARDLDPLSPVVNQRLAVVSLWVGDVKRAAELFEVANELGIEPQANPEAYVAFLLREKRFDEAATRLRAIQAGRGASDTWVTPVIDAIKAGPAGAQTNAIKALNDAAAANSINNRLYLGALIYMGAVDAFFRAVDPLQNAQAPTDVEVWFMAEAAPFRAHAGFAILAERSGLLKFWTRHGAPDVCATHGPDWCPQQTERAAPSV